MAATSHLKTHTQITQSPSSHSSSKPKRRKRRETTISTSVAASPSGPPPLPSSFSHIVSEDANWCCAPPSAPSPPSRTIYQPDPLDSQSPARSPAMDPHPHQPSTSFPAYPAYPSSYTKFNSALNAGLLNPMSPPPLPLDKTRSSPTLFDMMANEQEYHPRGPTSGINHSLPPSIPMPPPRALDRQSLLQDRVAELLGNCSPGNQFNDPDSGDVKLTLTSKDGLTVSLNVHRHILVANSRFFAAKLSDRWSKQQRSLPHLVEISDCDDVEVYIETLRLMYCKDLRRRLMREDVSKVLGILKVSAAIVFDAGVLSCLEYLEAAPWAEDEDEKVASLLSQLHLENSGAAEVLKRVSLEALPSSSTDQDPNRSENKTQTQTQTDNNGGEEILIRLLQVVLEGKDEKARREMKGLVSKMLRESNNGVGPTGGDISKESLYSACDTCLRLLHRHFTQVSSQNLSETSQIARQADNLHWMLDILIDRQIADEFLHLWSSQTDLATLHPKVPPIHRYEISRVTSRLFVGIGKGQILVSKEARCLLLKTWLEPFYEDFAWMRRACKGLDRHLIEDGLSNTVLTLPLGMQQEVFLGWFDRFLNSGEDCPNIQRGFEVWWRRAFWKRNGEGEVGNKIRVSAVENS